jgi:type II secretory pathway component PulK
MSRTRTRGQALVPVLFVVLILTALAVAISSTARRETRAAANYSRQMQEYYIAKGAVNYAAAELQEATQGGAGPPGLTPPPDTDSNGWTQLGDGFYKVEIIDTASRLNINTASMASIQKLPYFQGNPDQATLAAAIIDWRDTDDTPTNGGMESDYYEGLTPPYQAKNAPFDTIDELLLVAGMSPEILYGAPGDGSNTPGTSGAGAGGGITGRSRSRQGGSGGTGGTGGTGGGGQGSGSGTTTPESTTTPVDTTGSTIPMAELITTYSRELNVASDGTPRVNVKTASQDQIRQVLLDAGVSSGLATTLAQQTVAAQASITSIADLMGVAIPGGQGGQGGGNLVWPRTVMQQVADRITVTDGQYRNGIINVNTAPAEVLATIPGVDETVYNAIIQARQSGTVFTGMNDLFQITNLNREQFRALVDHVCTKSSVYLVRVKVRMPGGGRIYAAQALVELTAPPQQAASGAGATGGAGGTGGAAGQPADANQPPPTPKILQWREVGRSPGWANWITPPNYSSTGGTLGNR